MNIRQLDYFIATARSGSFAKAANELFISRQALSKAVHDLEHELGSHLIENHGNRLRLTGLGTKLLMEATPIITAYRDLERRYVYPAPQTTARQTLSVALAHGTSLSLPDCAVDTFRSKHPNIMLSLEEVTTQAAIDMARSGEADISLVGSVPRYISEFDMCLVVRTGLLLYLPNDDPLARRNILELTDLDGKPFVTFGKRNHLHRFFLEACEDAGVRPDIVMTTSDTDLLIQSAQKQHAYYFGFPANIYADRCGGRTLVPVDAGRDDVFGTYAIKQKGRSPVAPTSAFWSYLTTL